MILVRVPFGPINNIAQTFDHPQVKARELVVEVEHPRAGKIKLVGPAVMYNGHRMPVERPPPYLSQHTEEVSASANHAGRLTAHCSGIKRIVLHRWTDKRSRKQGGDIKEPLLQIFSRGQSAESLYHVFRTRREVIRGPSECNLVFSPVTRAFLSLTSQSPAERAQLHLYQGHHLSAISDIGTRRFPLGPANLINLKPHGDDASHLWKLVSKELMKIFNTFSRNTRYRA